MKTKVTALATTACILATSFSPCFAAGKGYVAQPERTITKRVEFTKACHNVPEETTRETLASLFSLFPTLGPISQVLLPLLFDGVVTTPSNPSFSYVAPRTREEIKVSYLPGKRWDRPGQDPNLFTAKSSPEQVKAAVKEGFIEVGIEKKILKTENGAIGGAYNVGKEFLPSFAPISLPAAIQGGGVLLLASIIYRSLTGELPPPTISLLSEVDCEPSGKSYRLAR